MAGAELNKAELENILRCAYATAYEIDKGSESSTASPSALEHIQTQADGHAEIAGSQVVH